MWELTDEGEQGQRPEAQKAKSECAAAQSSDSGSNVPHQGLLSIKLSSVYTPIIMPLKFRMEFVKVSRKHFVQRRWRFPEQT